MAAKYALTYNLKSKKQKFAIQEILAIDEGKLTYKPFKPTYCGDFTKKKKYGVKEGDTIIYHHIIALAGKSNCYVHSSFFFCSIHFMGV